MSDAQLDAQLDEQPYVQRCSDSVSHSLNTWINLADPDEREEHLELKDRILGFLTNENAIIIAHVIHFANITGLVDRGVDVLYELGELIQENHNDPLERLQQIVCDEMNRFYKVTDLCPSHRDLSQWINFWVIDSEIFHDDPSGSVCEDSTSYDYEEAQDAYSLYCVEVIYHSFLDEHVFRVSDLFNLDSDLVNTFGSTNMHCSWIVI